MSQCFPTQKFKQIIDEALQTCITSRRNTLYLVIESFLSRTKPAVNYTVEVLPAMKQFVSLSEEYKQSLFNLMEHMNVQGLNDKCTLMLSEEQTDMLYILMKQVIQGDNGEQSENGSTIVVKVDVATQTYGTPLIDKLSASDSN